MLRNALPKIVTALPGPKSAEVRKPFQMVLAAALLALLQEAKVLCLKTLMATHSWIGSVVSAY